MKHFYENIQGFFTFPNFYKEIVAQSKDGYHIVEIGSWKGRSSAYMAVEIINSNKNLKFDCIDTWNGSLEHTDRSSDIYEPLLEIKNGLFDLFLKNIEPVQKYVNVIRMPSSEASNLYEKESIDCVFIDASHNYNDVCLDIKSWLPIVRVGGLISGHDISHTDVKRAVYDTISDNNLIKTTPEDVWFFTKTQSLNT